MDRCHLKGSRRDALHVLLCAAGYSIRWVLQKGHQPHCLQQEQ
jgi:IS5 family transposase